MENIYDNRELKLEDSNRIKSSLANFNKINDRIKDNNKRKRMLTITNNALKENIKTIMKKYDLNIIDYNDYIFEIKQTKKKKPINKSYIKEKFTNFFGGNMENANNIVKYLYNKNNRQNGEVEKISNKIKNKNDLL